MKGIRNHTPSVPPSAPAHSHARRGRATGSFSVIPACLGLVSTLVHSGCAIRYHDAKTGTEHVWGLAHVKMRVAPIEGAPAPAVATQTEILGLGLGLGSTDPHFALGWDRRTRIAMPDDAALSIEWPTTQLFDVRLGARPPFLPPDSPAPQAAPAGVPPEPQALPAPSK